MQGEALAMILRNLDALKQRIPPPENTDAITVLDTGASLGAVSAQNEKRAQEDAAKQPPAKYTFTMQNGQLLMDATSVPVKSPVQQVQQAKGEPYANFAEQLRRTMQQSSQLAADAPDPEQVPDDPKALALELGIREPEFYVRDGIAKYRKDRSEYQKLLSDPMRLKRAVAAKRLKDRMDLLGEGSQAYNAVKTVEATQRADDKAARDEKNFVLRIIGDNDFRLNRIATTPDEAVDYVKRLAGDTWDESLAPLVKGRWAQDVIDDQRKEASDKHRDEKDDIARGYYQLAIDKFAAAKDKEPKKQRVSTSESYLSRASAEQLIAKKNDSKYDSDSADEAIDMAADQWLREIEKNSSEYEQNYAEMGAADTPMWKRDRLKERNKFLQQRNRRLVAERQKLLTYLDGGTTPPPAPGQLAQPGAQPAPPPQIRRPATTPPATHRFNPATGKIEALPR